PRKAIRQRRFDSVRKSNLWLPRRQATTNAFGGIASASKPPPLSIASGRLGSMPSFLSPLLRESASGFRLINERTGGVVADRLLAAFDSKTRKTGLLAHRSLPAGTAMIIAPTSAIHTFFMKFAIDVLFVAKDGSIVKTRESLGPWRVTAA